MTKQAKPRQRREDSFFGLHFDLHPHDKDTELGRLVTPEMVRRIIRAARPDYIQYDCKGHVGYLGYPDSKVSAVAGGPTGQGIVKDSLAIYRQVTAEMGVGLYVHFSGVWDDVACKDHPEWAAVDAQGKPSERYASNFGPYVIERMIPQMKEIVDRYDVDGFWVDGDCWAAAVDYGAAARRRFKEVTGQDQPPTQPGQPYWLEWMTLQRTQFFVHVRTYMDALHHYRPGVQIASNWLYSALSPEPVKMPVDFVSGDYSPNDSVNSARLHGRYLASVGLPWDLMAWAFSQTQNGHVYKTALQLQQEAATVLALGGGFQFYFNPDRHGGLADYQIRVMKRVADFCHARRELCHKSQPVPQVAVLYDTNSLFRGSPNVYVPYGEPFDAMQGALHAVLEAGHSADVLADHHLRGRIDEYPVVIVPEWDALSAGTVKELAGYVRRGGSLLLSGAGTAALFRPYLGVEFEGEASQQTVQVQVGRGVSGAGPAAVVSKGLWQTVKPAGAKVLAWRTPGYCEREGRTPAATLARLGKGRIAAFYGPLGLTHFRGHTPWLRDWVGWTLNRLYRPKVIVEGPGGTDLILRRTGRGLAVHLVNVADMRTEGRYGFLDRTAKVGPITLRIRMEEKPARVRLEPEGRRLRSTWRRGTLSVVVPSLHIHGAVVVG